VRQSRRRWSRPPRLSLGSPSAWRPASAASRRQRSALFGLVSSAGRARCGVRTRRQQKLVSMRSWPSDPRRSSAAAAATRGPCRRARSSSTRRG